MKLPTSKRPSPAASPTTATADLVYAVEQAVEDTGLNAALDRVHRAEARQNKLRDELARTRRESANERARADRTPIDSTEIYIKAERLAAVLDKRRVELTDELSESTDELMASREAVVAAREAADVRVREVILAGWRDLNSAIFAAILEAAPVIAEAAAFQYQADDLVARYNLRSANLIAPLLPAMRWWLAGGPEQDAPLLEAIEDAVDRHWLADDLAASALAYVNQQRQALEDRRNRAAATRRQVEVEADLSREQARRAAQRKRPARSEAGELLKVGGKALVLPAGWVPR